MSGSAPENAPEGRPENNPENRKDCDPSPKGPFRTKNTMAIAKIVNYYAVVFLLRPPDLLRRGPFLERENVCNSPGKGCPHKVRRDSKSQGDSKNTTRSKFTTRSIFSTAGSFGRVPLQRSKLENWKMTFSGSKNAFLGIPLGTI